MDYQLITTTESLSDYCDQISHCSLIAVDTEFLRERTYFPLLCLIQIASEHGHALIDPLADGMSLEPLTTVLTDENITKIFHSGDQDIELFYHELGVIPTPLLDSQIISQALGLGDTIAYHNLVKHMLDIALDKSQQYTHWNKRPLTDEQLEYALADVTHLLTIAPMLTQRMEQLGRMHWTDEAHATLADKNRFVLSPEHITKRVKHHLRKPIQLAALHRLAVWREERAMNKNLPRGFIMKDEVLAEIARRLPADEKELGKLRLLKPIKNEHEQKRIIDLLNEVRNADPNSYPAPKKKPDTLPNGELIGLLTIVLKQCCREANVASRLVASRKDLDQVALGRSDIPCMQGWRFDVFGQYAEQLLEGNLHFHWDKDDGHVVMD